MRAPFACWARITQKNHVDGDEPNLGLALAQQGELERGRAMQEQAFDARLRWLGEEHPDTLVSMSNLASTRAAQRDIAAR